MNIEQNLKVNSPIVQPLVVFDILLYNFRLCDVYCDKRGLRLWEEVILLFQHLTLFLYFNYNNTDKSILQWMMQITNVRMAMIDETVVPNKRRNKTSLGPPSRKCALYDHC